MNEFYSKNLEKNVTMLRAGEYHASARGEILYAIPGSCMSSCICNTRNKIGGMNHYLLPNMIHPEEILTSDVGRYGMYSMELLIGDLIKSGTQRKNLVAAMYSISDPATMRSWSQLSDLPENIWRSSRFQPSARTSEARYSSLPEENT
ncbi:MAG: hypothetical protein PHP23_01705 [Desulfobacterales bacterium]|nr:hypothetical protein [Desulfobacterales bacterium]MDD4071385.1 hypothetical protein [Desulfobacterales bacterium]MDD4391430.1 hypothetical protein [Desulfobacterales bacterium]